MDGEEVRPTQAERRRRIGALAQWRWRIRQDRHCRHCGALMLQTTLARRFCGVRCRVAHHRARRQALTLEQARGYAR
jgi:hypothetical protein